ncbi:DNA-binding protein SATB2 [Nymphon striatum]|nr:DNA-binding protein SATB2 [Nymphon striatum]
MCPACTNVWVRDLGDYRYPVRQIGECTTQYGKKDPSPNSDRLSQNHAILCVSANNEVEALLLNKGQKRKHGEYGRCDPTLQAQIAKYAVHHGNTAAAHYFAKILGRYLNESTVRGYVKKYNLELAKSQDSDNIDELPQPKRGKPLLLSKELDDEVIMSGNGYFKERVKSHFTSWYADKVAGYTQGEGSFSNVHVDLHLSSVKAKHASWLLSAFDKTKQKTNILKLGWERLVFMLQFIHKMTLVLNTSNLSQAKLSEITVYKIYAVSSFWTNKSVRYAVLELLKEMNQSRLAKISPLSQPIISGLVTDKTSDKISAQKAQEFGSWYLQYRAQHFGIHHFTNSSNLPKDSRFTFHPTKELPYMRSLYRQNKNPTDSALLLFVEELNCSEVRQHERPKVTLEKLKNWWKNERQRGKKVIVTSKNSRSQHKPNSLLRITSAFS